MQIRLAYKLSSHDHGGQKKNRKRGGNDFLAVFTLSTQGLVPKHRQKIASCSDTENQVPRSARVQGRDLVLGHEHRARILTWVLEKKMHSH